jgi:hypothetical protein
MASPVNALTIASVGRLRAAARLRSLRRRYMDFSGHRCGTARGLAASREGEKSTDHTAFADRLRPAGNDRPRTSVWKVNCGETGAAQRHRPNRLELDQPGEKSGSTPGPNSSASRRASLADVPNAIFVRALLSALSRKLSGYTTRMMPHDTILDREASRTARQ